MQQWRRHNKKAAMSQGNSSMQLVLADTQSMVVILHSLHKSRCECEIVSNYCTRFRALSALFQFHMELRDVLLGVDP